MIIYDEKYFQLLETYHVEAFSKFVEKQLAKGTLPVEFDVESWSKFKIEIVGNADDYAVFSEKLRNGGKISLNLSEKKHAIVFDKKDSQIKGIANYKSSPDCELLEMLREMTELPDAKLHWIIQRQDCKNSLKVDIWKQYAATFTKRLQKLKMIGKKFLKAEDCQNLSQREIDLKMFMKRNGL